MSSFARPRRSAAATPLVSVAVPAYNVGPYIAKALDSVLQQTYPHFEVVVVDDGSTDNTKQEIQQFSDPRIRLIEHPRNMGLSAARNTSIRQARGEFYAVLDGDDIALPNRLETQLAYLQRHPRVGVVGGGVTLFGEVHRKFDTPSILAPYDHAHFHAQQLLNAAFNNTTLMYRKAALESVYNAESDFYYDPRFLRGAEDYDLIVRLLARWEGGNLPQVLTLWQKRQSSSSKHHLNRPLSLQVQQGLIEAIGCPTDEATMALHHRLAFFLDEGVNPTVDEAFFRQIWQWMRQLTHANRQSRFLAPHALENVLWLRWILLCKSFRPEGWSQKALLHAPCRFHLERPSSWAYLDSKAKSRKLTLQPDLMQHYDIALAWNS